MNRKKLILFLRNLDEKEMEKILKSIVGEFVIENSNGTIENLRPELRIYNQPNIVTSEADIKTNLLKIDL